MGYAAAVYLRVVDVNGDVSISLVMAKSKVAPLKRRSLPQLELCGAHLLAKLLSYVSSLYVKCNITVVTAWTDSMIVLGWLRASPHHWKTFVSNRVAYIQDKVPSECWRHVRSSDNPADCASRGLLPDEVKNHNLWWHGPNWLHQDPDFWPSEPSTASLPEEAMINSETRRTGLLIATEEDALDRLIKNCSSLSRIKIIIAHLLRFVHNCRVSSNSNRRFGPISLDEQTTAMNVLIKHTQRSAFEDTILKLENNQQCAKPIQRLAPFFDQNGIIRVGGRLSNSQLSFNAKHPALLPRSHRLTQLVIEHTHKVHLHPVLRTLHFLLLQNFWILSPQRAVRSVIGNCNVCFRVRPVAITQSMAPLPSHRVQQLKPFQCVGVDFAGPFAVTQIRRRGAKSTKAYLCLFVCFTTKAVHLELASNLSTEVFLASLRRFIARRGRCTRIVSDCGTNFKGAAREIQKLMRAAAEQEQIIWEFNPPSAPHFGGLWEAGVKSVKTHLRRTIGEQVLTFEELYTFLTQIEAVLNSRPLCSISSDPNDLTALTPGHFLTLAPLTCLPEPDLLSIELNRLSRWQLLQRMHQSFWNRWHWEYLHTLQQRSKWNSASAKVTPGTLVLIKNDQVPPLQWSLGRVEQVHPGRDGVVRVATVKTTNGSIRRPVVKLCPLPSQ
jgi:hypothetical protein